MGYEGVPLFSGSFPLKSTECRSQFLNYVKNCGRNLKKHAEFQVLCLKNL